MSNLQNRKHVINLSPEYVIINIMSDHVKTGGGDLHAMLPKIPINPPGYKYLGPNNPLETQVDLETGIPRPGNEPTNGLDAIAMKHDLLYYYAEKDGKSKEDVLKRKHAADEIFVKEAQAFEGKTWSEKFWKWISKNLINAKMKLGLGLTENDIKDKIFKARNKKDILNYLRENVKFV